MVLLLTLRQLYHLSVGLLRRPAFTNKHLVSQFRAYPVDLDMFMHVNNTAYPRVAELASWQLLAAVGFLSVVPKKGLLALVVTEQKVQYLRQIKPFQKYEVHTTIKQCDNKWLDYSHKFLQHKSDVPENMEPKVYAIVTKRGVVKDLKGKTVKIEEYSQFLKNFE